MKRVSAWLLAGLAATSMMGCREPLRPMAQIPPQVEARASICTAAEKQNPLVSSARRYLGTPYGYGGRARPGKARPLDCLGLLYAAIQENYGTGWRSWSTTPSILIRQLDKGGKNTKTVLPPAIAYLASNPSRSFVFPPLLITADNARRAAAEATDAAACESDSLLPGDLLFLLAPMEPVKPHDVPVANDRFGQDLYVWHTGMYSGGGNWLHASPFKNGLGETAGVCEENLMDFMKKNHFSGFVRVRCNPKGV